MRVTVTARRVVSTGSCQIATHWLTVATAAGTAAMVPTLSECAPHGRPLRGTACSNVSPATYSITDRRRECEKSQQNSEEKHCVDPANHSPPKSGAASYQRWDPLLVIEHW